LNSKQLKCSINYHLKILLTYQQSYKKTDDIYIEAYNYLKQQELNDSQKEILYERVIEKV